ncbi:hypothetical protein [Geobacter pickeringii]|uniref:Uncharacterized protein n=1 Tax=Geobacter pickeringii TaxID=345632 RepID=A0A0B5BBW2_9BACT|nr:hypothetical protein [Geobacter pickeringii]AJE02509.1 hypothetical protein GPICK_03170 [Geobacter pickeringii]
MNRPPGRRLVAYGVVLILLCATALAGINHYGLSRRVYRTVGTVTDATVDRAEVETPENAYAHWRTTGVWGRKILFFAGEWEKIAPERFFDVPLERNYPLAFFNYGKALEEQRLDRRSFLYVATVTGIVREMGVVLPEAIYQHLAEQARSAKNARFLDGAVSLTYHGLPRTFMTLRHLRAPAEPLLVYVGASFFREHTPEELRAALVSAGVRTDSLVLCRMAGDERVTPEERERLAAFARLLGMAAAREGAS